MAVSLRKGHGVPTTGGGVMFQTVAAGVSVKGPKFTIGTDHNKLCRLIVRFRGVSRLATRAFNHQEMLLGTPNPEPKSVGKLHNDNRGVPYGVDAKWRKVLSTSHMFVAKLSPDQPFESEHRNSQKWLHSNDSVTDYFRHLQIFAHVQRQERVINNLKDGGNDA